MTHDSVVDLMIRIATCPLATVGQAQRAEELAIALGGSEAMLSIYIRKAAA